MKIVKRSNFRVVVRPKFRWNNSEKDNLDECEHIVFQIERHTDDIRRIDVEYDTEELCSHCGRDWGVSADDSDPRYPKGTPLCCEKARVEFIESLNK